MSLEQNLKDESANGLESFDDFLKELEEAEKNLSISDDLVVEFEDSFDDTQSTSEAQSATEEFALETFAAPEPKNNPASDRASAQELQKLQLKVSGLEEERGDLRTLLQRRQNDFDSFRKRTERERSETFENILGKLSAQMLPVVDNLSRALGSAEQVAEKSKEFDLFIEGILLVSHQLTDVLIEMGLQPIAPLGQPFDPHFHEAVATAEDGEKEPGTVIEEILTGYKIGKKVVRPAMVKVSMAPNAVKVQTSAEGSLSEEESVSDEPGIPSENESEE
ncbi:MAG TPA: nucleotide exchange factor GrpE [Pyrinomonadaceae bacterium]|jgi:molecular chaperone GrpE|nr:nucleotide exchange factor GrpE [Pyrinomonadaceae bacterium]